MPRFQPEEVLRVLARHSVRHVVIGGVAATLHGSNLRTGDLDICPAQDPENLTRLAAALRELEARVRTDGVPEGLPFTGDAALLQRVEILNLVTRHGDLDISFVPAGTGGYADLARRQVVYALDELEVPVADLEDVIRSKEAANRAKDREQLPTLRLLARLRKDAKGEPR